MTPSAETHVHGVVSALAERAAFSHEGTWYVLTRDTPTPRAWGEVSPHGFFRDLGDVRAVDATVADLHRALLDDCARHEGTVLVLNVLDATYSRGTRRACARDLEAILADPVADARIAFTLAHLPRLPVYDVGGARRLPLGPRTRALLDGWCPEAPTPA